VGCLNGLDGSHRAWKQGGKGARGKGRKEEKKQLGKKMKTSWIKRKSKGEGWGWRRDMKESEDMLPVKAENHKIINRGETIQKKS